MGFLSDLGSVLGEIQHAGDVIDEVKQEIFSVGKDAITNIEVQGKEVVADIQTNSQSISESVKTTTDDIRSQLNN